MESLLSNTTGNGNTANGYRALYANTTAIGNVAVGYRTLFTTTTGGSNTAIGNAALFLNTSGANNTASGKDALYSNTVGSYGVAVGWQALYSNTSGDQNTAIGEESLYGNTTGITNTAIGAGAMYSNNTGGNNVASGFSALRLNTTGSSNTAIGREAIYSNVTGSNNTAIGKDAGRYDGAGGGLSSLSNSVFLGYNTRSLATGQDNEIVIGANAVGLGTNTVIIGDGNVTKTALSGNVGIGTTSPWTTLSVNGTVAMPGLVNDSTGYYVCLNTTTGQLATSTGVCGASSIKYKENLKDISYGLSEVLKLRAVSFDYKDSYIKDGKRQVGFIAEEVAPIIPEVVSYDSNGEIQGLDYPKFTAVLAKAIQELNKKFDDFASSTASVIGSVKNLVLDSLTSTTVYTREITADKANVVDFNVSGKMNVNSNVCVNNTCITKDQFEQMILRSGVGTTQVISDGIENNNSDNPTSTNDTSTTTPETATTTPVIEEQNTASTTPVSNDTDENVSATSTDSVTE